MPQDTAWARNHLAAVLRSGSAGREDADFLKLPGGDTVSFGAFFEAAERMAAALTAAGVRPGDRMAVQAPKTPEFLQLYLGSVLAGAVFLPLNTAYTPAEVAYFLQDAEPTLFVCDPDRSDELSAVARRAGVSDLLTLAADGGGSLAGARDAARPGREPVPRAAGDLAAILYTSGTTGRSKGAMLSHRALASNSSVLAEYWRFARDDVLIHALPVFHTHGLFVATNVTMIAGGSLLWLARFDAETVRDAMPGATALMGVPTFYTRLLDVDGLAEAARHMRLFISGSAPLLPATHERWREITGHAIVERYGMTETNMNSSNPYDGPRRPGTVGHALPGVALRVTDPVRGTPVPTGETGMIEVRGENLFSGYWKMPEKTAEEMRDDGFFVTGDLGTIDDQGYLHIVGRARDLVISGGYNVYPREIEAEIDGLDGVAESAVIGVAHPDLGEAVLAVVVAEPGAAPGTEEIRAALAGRLARYKLPRRVELVEELPRNTMGKVQKNELRKMFAGALS